MSWLCEHEPEWFHGHPDAPPAARRPSTRGRMSVALSDRRNVVLVATILGSAMAFIDATVVNVALPAIGDDLHLGLAGRQWVFLSYSLVLASLYLVAGAVGDRIGQRRVFLGGALGFAVTSALAGAAPSGAFLIGARALQGVAAAFLTTGSLALLRATFGSESGRAVGLWTAWTGITTIAGPPLGGAMVELASWRWIFYFNLPLAAAAALLAHRAAHDDIPPPDRARPFDVGGAALMAIGFAALTYALVEGASRGVGAVWWAIAVAVGGLAAAVLLEWLIDDPMLPLPLFRRRNFAVANLVTLLVYAGLGGSTFFLVLYLQTVIGYSPIQASLVMVPISVVMLLLAGRFGRLADRQGPAPLPDARADAHGGRDAALGLRGRPGEPLAARRRRGRLRGRALRHRGPDHGHGARGCPRARRGRRGRREQHGGARRRADRGRARGARDLARLRSEDEPPGRPAPDRPADDSERSRRLGRRLPRRHLRGRGAGPGRCAGRRPRYLERRGALGRELT